MYFLQCPQIVNFILLIRKLKPRDRKQLSNGQKETNYYVNWVFLETALSFILCEAGIIKSTRIAFGIAVKIKWDNKHKKP